MKSGPFANFRRAGKLDLLLTGLCKRARYEYGRRAAARGG
jgi:hypothetical protein